jgi:hypothetical protein
VTGSPFVIETRDGFVPDELFLQGRDQVVVAVRIAPIFGQVDLTLLAAVLDEARARCGTNTCCSSSRPTTRTSRSRPASAYR